MMMKNSVFIDVETQYSFREVNNDLSKLRVSLVGTYDSAKDSYRAYRESDLPEFFRLLEHAGLVIGFNINKFDLPVLAPYYLGKISQFKTLDLLEVVENALGRKLALNDIAGCTLGVKKSGHGLMAIEYYRKGDWKSLESYCLDDVKITKEVYEYIGKNGKIKYQGLKGIMELNLKLPQIEESTGAVSLSLPF